MKRCCLCGKFINGWGNNPYPLGKNSDDECCAKCNYEKVVPARIKRYLEEKRRQGQ